MTTQKIVPHLWFDTQAKEAASFYVDVFDNSKINSTKVIKDTPSGDCDIVSFSLLGHEFMAISAGPLFKLNPSISFLVGCETKEEVDTLWNKLIENGKALMPLDTYPFSERYGWVEDKFGVTWQLIFTKPEGDERPRIVPALLFTGEVYGKAKDAVDWYCSAFKESKLGNRLFYEKNQEPNKEGTVMFSDFKLGNTWLAAMDGAVEHAFKFNEAISLMVNCEDQNEIDHLWKCLSFDPNSEQCGWIKDKFGVSWQIVPKNMEDLLEKNPEKTTPAMLKMKKIVIEELKRASED